jgi:hypothetical protein
MPARGLLEEGNLADCSRVLMDEHWSESWARRLRDEQDKIQ